METESHYCYAATRFHRGVGTKPILKNTSKNVATITMLLSLRDHAISASLWRRAKIASCYDYLSVECEKCSSHKRVKYRNVLMCYNKETL